MIIEYKLLSSNIEILFLIINFIMNHRCTLHSLEFVIQIRTVWSLEHEANSKLSTDTLTILTHSRWPTYVFTQYL